MQIDFDSGERLTFSWRNSGELHVDLMRTDPVTDTRQVTASANVSGEALVHVLETFTLPLFRRALLNAALFPKGS